ncbi:MAG: nucleotidyltransferase domain-containing protein [Dehalococcoidia bacterium]
MLANLFGSRIRAKLLAWLFTHPDEKFFIRQLTGISGEDPTNVGRELARLEEMGILLSTNVGRHKFYQANRDCSFFNELQGLAIKTAGMADVISEALAPVADKITFSFVYGSMASGEYNSTSDIDLLIVGDPDEIALHKAVNGAEEKLGRTINYTLISNSEFDKRRGENTGFFARIIAGPKIQITGSINES